MRLRSVLVSLSLLSLASVAAAEPLTFSVVGTSDLHGALGQLPLLGGYLDNLRAAQQGRVLLLDAGDMYQGSLESDANEGDATIAAYGALGYAAIAIGNHDFDFGPVGPAVTPQKKGDDPRGNLRARAMQAKFPFLAANILDNGKPLAWKNVAPTAVVTLPGTALSVGLIGVTTMGTPKMTIAANFKGLSMAPMREAVVTQANRLREQGVGLVVVVAHAGGRCAKFDDPKDLSSCDPSAEIFELARELPSGLVDAIVAGHVHAGIAHEVNGVAITEAFSKGESFGRVDFVYDTESKRVSLAKIFAPERLKKDASYEGKPVVPRQDVAAIVAPALALAEQRRNAQTGSVLEDAFPRGYSGESPLGNLVTAIMLELEPRASLSLTNGGGLRADLPAGPLSYGAVYNALPFDNKLTLVRIPVKTLKGVLADNMRSKHGVLTVGGARVVVSCGAGGVEVELLGRDGKPIVGDVKLVTSDFLATGGEGFSGATMLDDKGPVIREAVVGYLQKHRAVFRARDWFDSARPRLVLPGPRPVSCGAGE